MPNYEVGDTVEEINIDGDVLDTGVVTKIEEYGGTSPNVFKVWAMWEVDKHELHFPSNYDLFRIKTKRPSEPKITLETVSKVLGQYFKSYTVTSMYTPEQLRTAAKRVFDVMLVEQQELQRQNDPEYQKYLELKKKFETA